MKAHKQAKITLSMVVRNEAGRYLRRALEHHRQFIDSAVIIDDGSEDETAEVCKEMLAGLPLKLVRNTDSAFSNEVKLRKQQWEETASTQPEWILNLDGDEIFEAAMPSMIAAIVNQQDYDAIYFRLYDMWNDTHYREDMYWQAHLSYRPFLVRYRPDEHGVWKETAQHCGRFPLNVYEYPYQLHSARIRHFGWAAREDRVHKYDRYMRLDPGAKHGWMEQYKSILDENPTLKRWEE